MATIGVVIFLLVLIFGLLSIIFGLPGTIIIFLATLVYGLVTSFDKINLKLILILLTLTILAEVIEFAVGVFGAKKFTMEQPMGKSPLTPLCERGELPVSLFQHLTRYF